MHGLLLFYFLFWLFLPKHFILNSPDHLAFCLASAPSNWRNYQPQVWEHWSSSQWMCVPYLLYIQIYQSYLGCHFEVKLLTQKCVQTGVSHTWHLFANDNDPHSCPMCALLWLAALYGEANPCTGPLFLKVNSSGGVMFDQPMVHIINILVHFFIILIFLP